MQQTTVDAPARLLRGAATAYLIANLAHGADHLRQHLAGLNETIKLGGGLLTLAAVVTFVLVLRGHRRGPAVAAVVGTVAFVLVVASHVVPHWSVVSDSYVDDVHADALSWIVVLLEIGTSALLSVAGIRALDSPTLGTGPRPPTAALPDDADAKEKA